MTQPVDFQTYLQQTFQAAQPQGTPTMMVGGPPPAPPPMDAGPPPPPAGPPAPPLPPAVNVSAPQPPPNEPPPGIPDRPFPLVRVKNGHVTPAHEVDLRGPSLKKAQDESNATDASVIDRVAERNQQAAAVEYNMMLQQERQAQARQAAVDKANAEREAEMQERMNDFDSSAKALSQSSMDPDRFWSSRSTGQKVAGVLSVALGGFLQGARGGSNPGLDILDKEIDRDMKAQEFDYFARKNATEGKQTAFAMAMQKYQNADAARAMARAASYDALEAQLGQMRALYQGTDAANRADQAIAGLQAKRTEQIQQGVRFLQPSSSGPVFIDPRTGIQYTNKEAQGVAKDYDAAENERGKIALQTAGDVIKEGAKVRAESQKDADKSLVTLPNGDTVQAPTPTEAGELRTMAANASEVRKLVNEAKKIREDSSWALSPTKIRELKRIQSNLVTAYGVSKKLGALSDSDMNLALDAAGKLTSTSFGVSDKLEHFANQADEAWRSRVKTYPNAPASAKGVMPASFTPHGKAK